MVKKNFTRKELTNNILVNNKADMDSDYKLINEMEIQYQNIIKLYLLNAVSFGITMMDWLEPVLKVLLLLVTIGYTAHKWWKLNKSK